MRGSASGVTHEGPFSGRPRKGGRGRGWGGRGSRALASRCRRHPVSLHSCCRVSREMLGCRVVRPPPSKQTSTARLGSCGKRARWQQRSARGPRPERRLRADAVPGGLGGPHESALRTGRMPAGSPSRAEGPQMAFVHRSLRFVCFQTEVTTFNSDEKSFLKIVIAGKKKIVTILGIKF